LGVRFEVFLSQLDDKINPLPAAYRLTALKN